MGRTAFVIADCDVSRSRDACYERWWVLVEKPFHFSACYFEYLAHFCAAQIARSKNKLANAVLYYLVPLQLVVANALVASEYCPLLASDHRQPFLVWSAGLKMCAMSLILNFQII